MNNFEASNKADWSFKLEAVDEDGDVIFTDAEIAIAVADGSGCKRLEATTANGKVTLLSDTQIEVRFTSDDMKNMPPASYNIGGVYKIADDTQQMFIGTVSIYDGIACL